MCVCVCLFVLLSPREKKVSHYSLFYTKKVRLEVLSSPFFSSSSNLVFPCPPLFFFLLPENTLFPILYCMINNLFFSLPFPSLLSAILSFVMGRHKCRYGSVSFCRKTFFFWCAVNCQQESNVFPALKVCMHAVIIQ